MPQLEQGAVCVSQERDQKMRHLLHHEEGEIGVAFCGFRKRVREVVPKNLSDCAVCNELWISQGWSWAP